MGRNDHTLRLLLGLSSTLPPDWLALAATYTPTQHALPTSSIQPPNAPHVQMYETKDASREVAYGRAYDEKGRPVGAKMRQVDRERCEAMNVVMRLGVEWVGRGADEEEEGNREDGE